MPAQAELFRDAITTDTVLRCLRCCAGERQGRTARQLVLALTGRHKAADERRLRQVIEALRLAGHPICGHPSRGYYWANNAAELERTCEFLYGRSMTSLRQVCALKRVTLPDLRGQLGLALGATHERDE